MKKVLIVIDYQADFVDGSLGFPAAVALEGPICEKIRKARAEGTEVIFTFDTHTPDYLSTQEGRNLPVVHCVEGTAGWELYGEAAQLRQERDICLCKPGFGSLELAELLRDRQYEEIELVGVVSNICVLSNAILAKAALPEALITVDAACTAGSDPALHAKALDLMESLHIRITNRIAKTIAV